MLQFTKPKRNVNQVFLHCSASDNPAHDDVSVITQWHIARGFTGIGYHYFIKSNGEIQLGRDVEIIPSAQKESIIINGTKIGGNTNTIAICLHGLTASVFSEAQYASLRAFCNQINNAYNKKITFHGHCEVSKKTCPVFDYKKVLNLDANGYITPIASPAKPIGIKQTQLDKIREIFANFIKKK